MTLPKGWTQAKIGELADFVTSGSRGWAKYYSDDGAAFIRIQNIRRGSVQVNFEDIQHVRPPSGVEGERTKLFDQDILVTITADLGRIGLFSEDVNAYVNQHIALVRLLDRSIAPYVATYLISDDAQAQLGLRDRGMTRSGLGLDDIRGVHVPLPPGPEQRRIGVKLDALTARIARARSELDRVPVLAEKLRQSVVLDAFSGRLTEELRRNASRKAENDESLEKHFAKKTGSKRKKPAAAIDWQPELVIPDEWRWVSVDRVIAAAQYGSSSKTDDNSGGIPVLRMGNIQNGELDFSNLKYLPSGHHEFPDLLLSKGDVLFNRTNSFELVGKSAVFRGASKPMSFASYLIRLQCSGILSDLLVRYLNSPIGRSWIESVASQQVGQANVNGTKLRSLGIPLPSPEEQVEMKRQIDLAFARADRLEAEATRARKLLDRLESAILAKAFRGELVPQDPNDEPASVLLERIRAERVAAPKAKRTRRSASP